MRFSLRRMIQIVLERITGIRQTRRRVAIRGSLFIVAFLVTYFLILPARTIEKSKATDVGMHLEQLTTISETIGADKSPITSEATTLTGTTVTEKSSPAQKETLPQAVTEATTTGETHFSGELEAKGDAYQMRINVQKDAELPEDTALSVTELKAGSKEYQSYKEKVQKELGTSAFELELYDITLMSKGQELEPKAPVQVEINYDKPLDTPDKDMKIVHFKDNGKIEVLGSKDKEETKAAQADVAFVAGSFSVYAIVKPDGTTVPRYTYRFQTVDGQAFQFKNDSNQLTNTQIIKTGESLYNVGLPPLTSGQTFKGWFIYDTATNQYGDQVTFQQPVTVTTTKDIYVRPKIESTAYATFYIDPNKTTIYSEPHITLTNGVGTLDFSNFSVPAPSNTQFFVGWATSPNGAVISATDAKAYKITTNMSFFPVFKTKRNISFVTGDAYSGASFVPPKYVLEGQDATSVKPTDPTKLGYTFDGWYTAENGGGTKFDFAQPVTKDVVLYANWKPGTSSYTIVYWQQYATDSPTAAATQKNYQYAGQSAAISATVGSTVYLKETDKITKEGFYYTTDRGETSTTVKADGSSVINIYYNRKLIIMKFLNEVTSSATDYKWTDSAYTSSIKTLTGLYGSSLESNQVKWPTPTGSTGWRYYTTSTTMPNYSGMSYLGDFILPTNVYNYNGTDATKQEIRFSNGSTINTKIYFYRQKLDGSYSAIAVPDDTGTGSGGDFTFSEKFTGFKVNSYAKSPVNTSPTSLTWSAAVVDSSTPTKDSAAVYQNLYIRYERQKYKLSFLDSFTNQPLRNLPAKQIYYQDSLSQYKPDTSIAANVPVTSKVGYRFNGKWYKDPKMTQEYDWKIMQASDIAVYAGWEKIKYNITIRPEGGVLTNSSALLNFTEFYGDKIPENYQITKDYIEDTAGQYYYNPTTAKYTLNASETGVDLTKRYINIPGIYSFVGWNQVNKDGTETPYNFSKEVTGDVTLKAVWQYMGDFKLKYQTQAVDLSGKPLSPSVIVTNVPTDPKVYEDKGTASVLKNPDIPSGYLFMGWYYNGAVYKPYDSVVINANLANSNRELFVSPVLIPVVKTTQFTYDANGGSKGTGIVRTTIKDIPLNSTYTAESADYFVRTGYNLIGWNTSKAQADAGTVQFKPGDQIGLDNAADATNILYAVWQKKTYTVTVKKKVVGIPLDKMSEFNFHPSDTLSRDDFMIADGGSKEFKAIPYGTVIFINEWIGEEFANYMNVTIANRASGDADRQYQGELGDNITVDGNVTIEVVNTRAEQGVAIQKVSALNPNKVLSGAEFDLYQLNADGSTPATPLYGKLTSDTNGNLQFPDGVTTLLPLGKFILRETKAPNGYFIEKNDISISVTSMGVSLLQNNNAAKVSIDADGVHHFKVTNSEGTELPSTGGMGVKVFYISGFLLLTSAVFLLQHLHKQKEQ